MSQNYKSIRAQMALVRPLLESCSLKTIRKGQNMVGEMMNALHKEQVILRHHAFPLFEGAWIIPKDQRRQGVILYLHGGGFTCGDLEYATGFGSTLAVQCGCRVFCPAYRLAPETPFPGALEDAIEAYQYLLQKGYTGITLIGESAGGGLCFSLCLRLKEMGLPVPKGIVAISPWADLTLSGESHEENKDKDSALSAKQLRFFADAYASDPKDPLISPIYADLSDMPPCLLIAAQEEILRSDTQTLARRLRDCGCSCSVILRPDRWHAFVLYGLKEDKWIFTDINHFLDKNMHRAQKLRWMRLDNAAKIYPAARNQNWSSIFRISTTLHEAVDKECLEQALDVTLRRFPSIAVRLRRGIFWYYLQQLENMPPLSTEYSYPLTKMDRDEVRRCAFRVIVHDRRIAVEFFHSLTDGSGALVFLKSLVAEYIQQKYNVHIPAQQGVLGRLEEPSEAELEDSFLKYAGPVKASRAESDAWHLSGTPEPGGFNHLTCMILDTKDVLQLAHREGVSMTCFLTAVMLMALQNMQAVQVPHIHRRKRLKVQIPINLRNIFPSKTMRNFAFYTTPEIDPRLGEYSFSEICQVVKHKMGQEITAKQLSMKIATNVGSEKSLAIRIMPLFIKNIVMKAVFDLVGEKKQCLSISNLGNIKLPEEMLDYVQRMDFILGVQASAPHNCGVLSFQDKLYVNFIRDTKESDLEYHFYCVLRDMGLRVQVESNRCDR